MVHEPPVEVLLSFSCLARAASAGTSFHDTHDVIALERRTIDEKTGNLTLTSLVDKTLSMRRLISFNIVQGQLGCVVGVHKRQNLWQYGQDGLKKSSRLAGQP